MSGGERNQSEYFLKSQRLGFRAWRPDDLELAFGLWGDAEVSRFIDARGELSRQQVEEILEKHIASEREHGIQYWPVFLLQSGEHVGCCGLRPYRPEQKIHELGVHLRKCFWGKGLAAEACEAVIRYAFENLGASALFAGHNPKNQSSRRLLEKLGFRYTHSEFYAPTGLEHPSYILRFTDLVR